MGHDSSTAPSFEATIKTIRNVLPEKLQNPRVGVICGSGLSGLVNDFREVVLVPYEDIPGFSTSTGEPSYYIVPLSAQLTRNLQCLGIKVLLPLDSLEKGTAFQ